MLVTKSDKELYQKMDEENKQRFYYIAYKVLQREREAENAMYTGLIKVARRFLAYRDEPYEKLVELCNIVIQYHAYEIERSHHMNDEEVDDEVITDITSDKLEQILKQCDQEIIIQAILQLKEEDKIFLKLQYGIGLSAEEIGELLDMPQQSVRKRMQYCRNRLAKVIERGKWDV